MDTTEREVMSVVAVDPITEATVEDLAEVIPGCVVVPMPDMQEDAIKPEAVQDTRIEVAESEEPTLCGEVPPHKNGKLRHVLECMLFVAGEPMTSKQLADTLELDCALVEAALQAIQSDLADMHGLQLAQVAGGWQFCTRPEYSDYCTMILRPAKKKLSKAALETLAVVAYRQPCTMPEIEAVRGVSADGVIRTLLERGLIKEAGRKQVPGRPILYTTTQEFLEHFGLNDVSELPDIDTLAVEQIRALEAQKQLFEEQLPTSEADKEEDQA